MSVADFTLYYCETCREKVNLDKKKYFSGFALVMVFTIRFLAKILVWVIVILAAVGSVGKLMISTFCMLLIIKRNECCHLI